MQAQAECDRCFLRQTQEAARRIGLTPAQGRHLLAAVRDELARFPASVTPPVKASRIHALIREFSANPDPYRLAKQQATTHALALYPRLKALAEEAPAPLETAVRLAIAGNIIDLGVGESYDLEANITRVLAEPLAIDHLDRLKAAITGAETILYLADNAGETVFDRLLIETIGRPLTYVVKGGPAVNDATREDALEAGLGTLCAIIDSGAATLGTLLDQCGEELRQRFWQTDLVIAKGMANFESLSGSRHGLYFLLQVKCPVVASHLGIAEKGLVVLEDAPARE
jgi:uncharacterized protein with ATP-grasp and redox domains